MIASSDSITLNGGGTITANGGDGGACLSGDFPCAGGGSGGAIRLMAPKIQRNGNLSVAAGSSGIPAATNGRVRIEAFQHQYNFSVSGGPAITSSPFDTFISSTGQPTIRVVTVAGVPVNPSPSAIFEVPDVVFNSPDLVPVLIEAKNVPLTATVKLQVISEDGPDQTFAVPALTPVDSETSRATISVKFPTGFSRGFLRATFTATP